MRLLRSMPADAASAIVAADIDEEFQHHIYLLEQDLIVAGLSHDEAAAAARARFGNADRHRRECIAIALKENLMGKRIHLTITIILAVALGLSLLFGAVAMRQARAQAERARAQEMVAREQAMQAEMAAREVLAKAEAAEKAMVPASPAPQK